MGKRARRQVKMAEGGVINTLRDRNKQIDAAVDAAVKPAPAPAAPAPSPASTTIVPGLADQMAARQAARKAQESAAPPAAPPKKFLGLFADGDEVGLRNGYAMGGAIGPFGFRVSKSTSPWERDQQGNLPSEWGRDASGALESEWNKPKPNMGLKLGSIVTDDEGNQSLMANPAAPKPKEDPNYGLHFADGGGVGLRDQMYAEGDEVLNRRVPLAPEVSSDYGYGNARMTDAPRSNITQTGSINGRTGNVGGGREYDRDTGLVDPRTMQYFRPPVVDPADTTNVPGMRNPSALNTAREGLRSVRDQFPHGERLPGGVRDLVGMSPYGGAVKPEGMPASEFTALSPNQPANMSYKDETKRPTGPTAAEPLWPISKRLSGVGPQPAGYGNEGRGSVTPSAPARAPGVERIEQQRAMGPPEPTAPPVPNVAAPTKSADTKFINEQLVVPTRPVPARPVTPDTPAGPTLSDLIAPRRKSAAPAAPPTLNVPDVTGGPTGAGRVPPPLLDVPDATGLRTGAGRVPAPALDVPDVTGRRHPYNETQVPMQHVRVAATRYGIPHDIAEAQIRTESGGNPNAVGPMTKRGASEGLAQILPSTGAEYGVKNAFDPQEAADFHGRYMRDLLKMHGGDMDQALAAYNTGPGNLAKAKAAAKKKGTTWMDEVPQETRDYVAKINKRAEENRKRKYADGGTVDGMIATGHLPEADNMNTSKYSKRVSEQVGLRGIPQFADGGGVGGTALAMRGHQINRKGKHGGIKDGMFYGEGGPTQDKVHIRASPGEFIVPADSAKAIGLRKLRTMVAATHTPVHLGRGLADGDEVQMFEEGDVVKETIAKRLGRWFSFGRKKAADAAARAAEATRNTAAEFNAGRQAAAAEAAAAQTAAAAEASDIPRTVVPTATGAPEEVAVVRTPAERLARPEPVIQPSEPSPMGPRGQPAGPSGAPPSPMGPRGPVGPPPTPPPFTLGPDPGAPRGGRTSAPPLSERYANLPPEAQVGEGAAPKAGIRTPAPMDSPWQRAKIAMIRDIQARGGLGRMAGNLSPWLDPAVTGMGAYFDAKRAEGQPLLQAGRYGEAAAESGAGVAAGLKAYQLTPGPWPVKLAAATAAGWAGHQAGLGGVRAFDLATGGEGELPSEMINKQFPRAAAAEPYKPNQTPEQAKVFMEQAVKDAQEGKYGEGLRGGSTAPPLPRAGEVDATDLKAPVGGGFASGIDRDAVNPETGERGMPRLMSIRDKRDYNIYGITDTSTPEEKAADKARRADWTAQSAAIDEKNARAGEFERRSLRDMVQQNQMNTANYDLRQGLQNRDPAAVAAASNTLGLVKEAQNRQAVLDAKQADTAGEMAKAKMLAEAERYRADIGLQGNMAQAEATYKGHVLTAGVQQAQLDHMLGKENAKDFQDEIGDRAKVFGKDEKGKPYLDEAATARNVANLKRFMIDPAADHIAILQSVQPGARSLRDVPREKWGSVLDRAMVNIGIGAATGGEGMPSSYSARERGLGDVFAGRGVNSMVNFWPTLFNNVNPFAPPERDITIRSSVPGSLPTDIPLEDLGAGQRARYESILDQLRKSKDPLQRQKAKDIADRLGLRLQ